MAEQANGELSPDDVARLTRWHAAGRPPIPLLIDSNGDVQATAADLATILRSTNPAWWSFRAAATRWVDEHIREEG